MFNLQGTQRHVSPFCPKSFWLKEPEGCFNFVSWLPNYQIISATSWVLRVAGLETDGAGQETKRNREASLKQPQTSVPLRHGLGISSFSHSRWLLIKEKEHYHLATTEASGYLWWAEPPVVCLHFLFYCFCSLTRMQRFDRGKSFKGKILKSTF